MWRSYAWRSERKLALGLAFLLTGGACGNPLPGRENGATDQAKPAAEATAKAERGEAASPPFALNGELSGLLLVWFDQDGLHTANKRSDIPEARRAEVRVEALNVAPAKRLDPDHVYVADVRAAKGDGSYPVRVYTRAWFDAQVDGARPAPPKEDPAALAGVTIYKASWCGACRAAARFLRERNVNFVEKDIEKDQAANAEMQRKAAAAGKHPSGVPVIDFRGQIVLGFDAATLDRLIASSKPI